MEFRDGFEPPEGLAVPSSLARSGGRRLGRGAPGALRSQIRSAAPVSSLLPQPGGCLSFTRAAPSSPAPTCGEARRRRALLPRHRAPRGGYLWHYAFSLGSGCGPSYAASTARLLAAAAEASCLRSATDVAQWMHRHYADVRDAAAQLFNGLLVAFSEEGPLREVVMDVKWEVEEGELLKDCLEVGAKDLQGLLVIAKDLFSGVSRAYASQHNEL